ncbi:NAD(P)-dependent alcohol dehydrogenase [Pluralibacter gergoviae]|uniref:NAD(P)-dependent alcohol dehydrogenase n=1 Tax=Pluralibacter gergoviae TaxID=61647 RepID=UPI0005ED06EF|nr:NAD(P)-dependent alcohol dehydrogenase [Pluralibacter gergoviae]KJM65518.1 alcohol dehydrogenase [Pluralibacter gergoviae]KMK17371.1 alcohol dehydrogenase [Pluralibacter gergoviae]OUR03836.1 NAD(P)-dependent alcohol dehydrogenase [Pluralibacter gergoviae]
MTDTSPLRRMTAAVVRETGAPFSIEEAQIRAPQGSEVLVRIIATGLCHTDLIVRDQYYPVPLPAVLGHEGAGIVEEVGPLVRELQVGDHVVLTYGTCQQCHACHAGHESYCESFFALNFGGGDASGHTAIRDEKGEPLHDHFFSQSSFATFALAQESNAVKVTRDAPLRILGPLGCGIQTGAGAVINSLKVSPGSSFASFGAGAVGLSAVMAAKACGATTIVAVDIVPSRLELAAGLGATHCINAKEVDAVKAIHEITGRGVDYALESTGNAGVLETSIETLGKCGTLGIVGAPKLGTRASFDINNMILGGRRIIGIVEGDSVPKIFIPQLIDLYMQGKFPFDRLVKYYPLSGINQAAQDSIDGSTLKPILLMP